jgi:hypothetical protein
MWIIWQLYMPILGVLAAIAALVAERFTLQKMSQEITLIVGFIAVILFLVVVFVQAPKILGAGYLPSWEDSNYTDRLSSGVLYHLVTSIPEKDRQVLFLQEKGTSNFYAIRVKAPVPPEDFVLVKGEPVAIAK